jgi:hypothetical protein
MEDLRLRLPHVVASGVPYVLQYRMTENKTVELKAQVRTPGKYGRGHAELAVDVAPQGAEKRSPALDRVHVLRLKVRRNAARGADLKEPLVHRGLPSPPSALGGTRDDLGPNVSRERLRSERPPPLNRAVEQVVDRDAH